MTWHTRTRVSILSVLVNIAQTKRSLRRVGHDDHDVLMFARYEALPQSVWIIFGRIEIAPFIPMLPGIANGASIFEASFTADSLSADSGTWTNEGTLGSGLDITSLTGTVQSESNNVGSSINALCFDSSQTAQSDITYIAYDTNSDVRPDLTFEVWWRPDEYADTRDWILGHDDGGYRHFRSKPDDIYSGVNRTL